MNVYAIPHDLVFSPCKVDGLFWQEFHVLLSYLGNPEKLVELKNSDSESYRQVVDCLVTFVRETETELYDRGFLKEVSLPEQN